MLIDIALRQLRLGYQEHQNPIRGAGNRAVRCDGGHKIAFERLVFDHLLGVNHTGDTVATAMCLFYLFYLTR